MGIVKNDVVFQPLTNDEVDICLKNASFLIRSVEDRPDLHRRSYFEKFINIAMGEIAEAAVIKWFISKGKQAKSTVDKTSGKPDLGHDIELRDRNGRPVFCSIKASLSVYKSSLEEIIDEFQLSSKPSEIRSINIQVYFWLKLRPDNASGNHSRVTVPSNENMAIIGWIGNKQLGDRREQGHYSTENRETVNVPLSDLNSMQSLLQYLS